MAAHACIPPAGRPDWLIVNNWRSAEDDSIKSKGCLADFCSYESFFFFSLVFLFSRSCSSHSKLSVSILCLLCCLPRQVLRGGVGAQRAADRRAAEEEELQRSGGGFVQGGQGARSRGLGAQWEGLRRAQQIPGTSRHPTTLLSSLLLRRF